MNNLYELRGMLKAMFVVESDEYKIENFDRCIDLLDLAIDEIEKPKNGFSGNFKIYGEKEKEEDKSDAHESENDYKMGDEVFSVLVKTDFLVCPELSIIKEFSPEFKDKIKNLILGKTLQEATKRLSEIMNDA